MKGVSIFLILLLASTACGAAPQSLRPASVREREDAALALIAFPWQDLNYSIVFMPPRPGFRAMTISREHRIEVYARPGDDSSQLAYDIAHELGHAIDLTRNTNESRKKWMASRGIDPATPWFGCDRCSDFQTPAGDFAETFALFLLGPGHFSGRIAPPPTAEQLRGLASFFPDASLYTSTR